MHVARQLVRDFLVGQPIVKVLLGSFCLGIRPLPFPHNPIQFLSVDFGNVLNHHGDILGIKLACKFLIIPSILENNGLAQEVDGRS